MVAPPANDFWLRAVDRRGRELMAAVAAQDLEGIVAKRKSDPYRRGVHWWKVKNSDYSQAVGRHKLFNFTGHAIPVSARDGREEKPHYQGG
jgi:hypothetical protein